MSKISVAVLGATGMIGQRFIQMLEDHPYFEIEGLYASERSNGKKLSEVLKVRDHVYLDETMDMEIQTMDIKKISANCRIAFSGIPSDLAGPTETELAGEGVAVFTNAGSHRMDEHVPILIPEVNPDQIESIKDQYLFLSEALMASISKIFPLLKVILALEKIGLPMLYEGEPGVTG